MIKSQINNLLSGNNLNRVKPGSFSTSKETFYIFDYIDLTSVSSERRFQYFCHFCIHVAFLTQLYKSLNAIGQMIALIATIIKHKKLQYPRLHCVIFNFSMQNHCQCDSILIIFHLLSSIHHYRVSFHLNVEE